MIQQVLRCFGRLALCQIVRARHKLMPVGQDSARHERRIFELFSDLEHKVDAPRRFDRQFRSVMKTLHADVGVGRLECPDQRRKQRVGDAGWRGKPQFA